MRATAIGMAEMVAAITISLTPVATMAASIKLDMPPPVAVAPPRAGGNVQPVSLTRIGANIAPGTAWLELTGGVICTGATTDYWNESNNTVELATFDRVFREEMRSSGLSGGKDPNNLFEENSASDLQVGALITELLVKACERDTLVKYRLEAAATMNVEWQIYSASQGKVLARIKTHGGFSLSGGDAKNFAPIISGVFADNVRRLAADRQFQSLVTAPKVQAAPLPPMLVFTPSEQPMTIEDARNGVVVIFAGNAMGSGILISPDGYILTNHHVTGDSGRVRIRWADGTEVVGQVVRSDVRRDVALIRAPSRPNALSIRGAAPKIGETVFAIGTPLEKDFQNTLTRGVVSANRTYDGLTFIQSDVAVDHGNSGGPLLDEQGRVLGITQWVYAPDGVSHNLNFFIPIGDALHALGLTPAPAAAPKAAAASPPAKLPRHR